MSEYLSDTEQKEQILEWWNENGRFIVAGVGLGLIGIFGWRFWNTHLDNQAGQASVVFEEMLDAVNERETDIAVEKLGVLKDQFKRTPYVAQAYLLKARTAVEANDLPEAVAQLEAAIKVSKDRELTELAYFRLAKVRIAMQENSLALELLNKVKSKSYAPLVEELRGDIYRIQGDLSKARAAYEAAKTAMVETPIGDPNLLQMKLSDLGAAD